MKKVVVITYQLGQYFLLTVPAIIPAIFIGRYFNHKLKEEFFKYVYFGLLVPLIVLSRLKAAG